MIEIFKKKSFKDILAIGSSNLALKPIEFIKSYLVAKYLGPADYGLLSGVNLIRNLSKYGNLGFTMVAIREVVHNEGTNEIPEAVTKLKNHSYSYELLLSFSLFVVGIIASFFFIDSFLAFSSIILASLGLLLQKMESIANTEATINKKFLLIGKITFVSGLIIAVFISVLVPLMGIFASLIVPIPIFAVVIRVYYKVSDYKFSFEFDKSEFLRQVKIGFSLSLGSIAFGTYLYLERLLMITFLGLSATGLFSLGQMIVTQVSTLFLFSIKVRKIDIFENIGKSNFKRVNSIVIKETGLLLILSFACVIILFFAIEYFIPIFLEQYVDAIDIAELQLIIIPFKVLSSYASIVLISKTVDKQKILPLTQFLVAGFFLLAILIQHFQNVLTLKSYIIVDVLGYIVYNTIIFLAYLKYFYYPSRLILIKKNKSK